MYLKLSNNQLKSILHNESNKILHNSEKIDIINTILYLMKYIKNLELFLQI